MEFKVFDREGPPDELTDDLRLLFHLDEPAWETLANWFLTTESFDLERALPSPAIGASSMLPEQFLKCARSIKDLLEAWQASSAHLPDLQHDLLLLGFSTREIARLGILLERLLPVRARVFADFMRFEHETGVLPTLEDLNVVCDIRPIFDTHVSLDTADAERPPKLLGFSYIVLLGLLAEDFEGKTSRLSFQMTEQKLADLQVALQRARDQIAILKASTNAFSIQHQ